MNIDSLDVVWEQIFKNQLDILTVKIDDRIQFVPSDLHRREMEVSTLESKQSK